MMKCPSCSSLLIQEKTQKTHTPTVSAYICPSVECDVVYVTIRKTKTKTIETIMKGGELFGTGTTDTAMPKMQKGNVLQHDVTMQ